MAVFRGWVIMNLFPDIMGTQGFVLVIYQNHEIDGELQSASALRSVVQGYFLLFSNPLFCFPSPVCIFLLCASLCFPDSTKAPATFGQSSLGIRENVERHLKPRGPRALHSHQCGALALT